MFADELTFRLRVAVISADQIQQIHQATLELLECTVMQITYPRAPE